MDGKGVAFLSFSQRVPIQVIVEPYLVPNTGLVAGLKRQSFALDGRAKLPCERRGHSDGCLREGGNGQNERPGELGGFRGERKCLCSDLKPNY